MSIMEKNLPNASALESGDYLRMVTSDGESQKVDKTEAIGYDIQTNTTKVTIFDRNATTISQPDTLICVPISADWSSFSEPPEIITVTFDGVEYTCNRTYESSISGYFYGATVDINNYRIDFSNYPFAILFSNNSITLYTETAGTYTVKIEADVSSDTVSTTDDFEKAVQSVFSGGGIMICSTTYDKNTREVTLNKTYNELVNAISNGIIPVLINYSIESYDYDIITHTVAICEHCSHTTYEDSEIQVYSASFGALLVFSTSPDEQMTDTNPDSSSNK